MGSISSTWVKFVTRVEGISKVVYFCAEHYIAEGISNTEDRFEPARQVSRFLAVQLENSGLKVGREIEIFKTYSIAREVEAGGKQFLISVGQRGTADGWSMYIHSSKGIVSRIFGKTDPVELENLCRCLDEALRKDEKIEDIQWLTLDEWLER
jgi:hypothetical protein